MHILLSVFLKTSLFIALSSCKSWQDPGFWGEGDGMDDFRTYENDYGSRIEQYLEIAEDDLINSYKRNQYQMIRENHPRAVLHPRKDITLRELVVSSHEDGKITDQQKADYLKICDELYHLWDKHWKSADRKARRLGFDR